MNNKQTNRVTMFKTVSAYLDSHKSVWSAMSPVAAAVESFQDKIAAIDTAAQQQETPSGAADTKAEARDALEDVLFLTCEALAVLGHNTNDDDLLALTTVSPSALDILNAQELVNRATTVLDRANARKTELAVLQVTQANLDELTQALQAFATAKEQPRTDTVERMAQTASLSNLIRAANIILRTRIDRLVNLFRRSNPDFVSGYRGARVVVDRAATHTSAQAAGGAPPPTPKP
jgi:hypothetical protein